VGLNPSPFWGSGDITPENFFENIGANMCSLLHFGDIRSSKMGRKIDSGEGIYRSSRIGSAVQGRLSLSTDGDKCAMVNFLGGSIKV